MAKPLGGRGKKAPYETTVVRIPKVLNAYVEKVVDKFREGLLLKNKSEEYIFSSVSLEEAKELFQLLINKRQIGKAVAENLLQVLYEVDKIELLGKAEGKRKNSIGKEG